MRSKCISLVSSPPLVEIRRRVIGLVGPEEPPGLEGLQLLLEGDDLVELLIVPLELLWHHLLPDLFDELLLPLPVRVEVLGLPRLVMRQLPQGVPRVPDVQVVPDVQLHPNPPALALRVVPDGRKGQRQGTRERGKASESKRSVKHRFKS